MTTHEATRQMERPPHLRIGSLFSGIGGLELGLEWSGIGRTVWQVEHDPWCRSVLAEHWPEARRYVDVRDVDARVLDPVDLICGGFPCQDVSAAGSGAGLDGARSGLWWEFRRILEDLTPSWVVVENVASGANRWVDAVRGSMAELGYQTLPVPIGARDVGAPHRRNRIFLVGRLAADADIVELRHERQRGSGRRSGRVPAQGETLALNARPEADAPHSDRWGCEGERVALRPRVQCPCRDIAHRCDEPRRCRSQWPSVSPVRGVDDGPPSKLDEARLRSLGNAVVPQCAQVVGEVIKLLDRSFTDPNQVVQLHEATEARQKTKAL